ncbi:MAG: hypothetical protein GC149_03800 [Gammaproteobacteria bacterium]|nr:hypothetical protein [Gammaproteobacteria bacterium]
MSDKLVVLLNGQSVVEYDRAKRLPGHQRQYLEKMDSDMDSGIELNGESIAEPDATQRAKFVAMHMVQALLDEHDAMIAAGCAYLANRLPDLKQVKVVQEGEDLMLDLVFTDAPENQVMVQFDPSHLRKQQH